MNTARYDNKIIINNFVSRKLKHLLLVLVILNTLSINQAKSREFWIPDTMGCNKLPTTIDIISCINQRTKIWDSRLNQEWEIIKTMIDSPLSRDQFLLLKASQRLWIEYRDTNCRFYAAGQGTISQIDSAECMRRMTQDRAIELQLAGPQD